MSIAKPTNADYPKCYRQAEANLKRAQRKLSQRKKGGKNRQKQRRKVSALHEKVANQRITNASTAVVIEDFNMRGMAQWLRLGKSTQG